MSPSEVYLKAAEAALTGYASVALMGHAPEANKAAEEGLWDVGAYPETWKERHALRCLLLCFLAAAAEAGDL